MLPTSQRSRGGPHSVKLQVLLCPLCWHRSVHPGTSPQRPALRPPAALSPETPLCGSGVASVYLHSLATGLPALRPLLLGRAATLAGPVTFLSSSPGFSFACLQLAWRDLGCGSQASALRGQ